MTVCVLGSINLDVVASVERLPQPGETLMARGVQEFPGGKGANQAVAAARMAADTLMLGAVGADKAGEDLCAFLQSNGVDCGGVLVKQGQRTGQAFISVAAGGENMIVVASGANQALVPADIDEPVLAGREVFLAQLETPTAVIEALFASTPAQRGRRLLNAAPADPAAAVLFPLVDVLIVNETELAAYAGLRETPDSEEAMAAAARMLLRGEQQVAVVTLGAGGALAVDERGHRAVAGRRTHAVDTTGAGDCFCGALAAALAEGRELTDALELANLAASLSVESAGAAASMPSRAAVHALRPR